MSYAKTTVNGKTVRLHRLRAEAALGKPLPPGAEVHHADGSKDENAPLVICQDRAYHMLLHQRMRVVALGGNPNADRICCECRQLTPSSAFKKSMCLSCYQERVDASGKKLRDRRKAAGHCIACGEPADGFVRCQTCRATALVSLHKAREKASSHACA